MPITEDCHALQQIDRLIAFLESDEQVNDLWYGELQSYAIEQPVDAAVDKPEIAIFLAQESNLWATTNTDSTPRLYVMFIAFNEPEGYTNPRAMTRALQNVTEAMRLALRRNQRDRTAGVQFWHSLSFGGEPGREIPVGNITTIYSRERGSRQYSRTFFALHSRVKSARKGF